MAIKKIKLPNNTEQNINDARITSTNITNWNAFANLPISQDSSNYNLFVGDPQNDSLTTIAGSGNLIHDTGGSYANILDSENFASIIGNTTYAPYNANGYLPLSGGTMSGNITFAKSGSTTVGYPILALSSITGGWSRKLYELRYDDTLMFHIGAFGSASTFNYAYLGSNGYNDNNLRIYSNKVQFGDNVIWHAGNDGASSGLDADLLDGQHGSYYATASSLGNYLPLAGGTMTNTTLVSNLNAELLNGMSLDGLAWRYADITSGSTKWILVKTTLASTGNHRFIFHIIGNTYANTAPIDTVIQGVNNSSAGNILYLRCTNNGRDIAWNVGVVDGYICLWFQAINGTSVRFNCQSGASRVNRIDTITYLDNEPTSTYSSTPYVYHPVYVDTAQTIVGNKTLSGTTTFSGEPVLNNAIALRAIDTNGVDWNVLQLSSSNNFLLGYGIAAQGYNTGLYGNNIYFRYGTNRQIAVTIDSSGNTNIDGLTTITKASQQPLVVKRDNAGATQYTAVGFQTADTNLGAIGMNAVGEAFVREGTTSTYHRVYTSKNITISSSEPTSSDGSNGDIWIVI